MKTINIFLASSSELINDRNAFGNLVRRLDNIFEKRSRRIKLYEWEDDDDSITFHRKQDTYNARISQSDIFIAMFYKKAGRFTIEEFNTALELYNKNKSVPKIYVYCRTLDAQKGEKPSVKLEEFQNMLLNELNQYWCNYENYDSMRFHFVMQLFLLDNGVNIAVSPDSEIEVDGEAIVKMDKLDFIAQNETYSELKNDLAKLEQVKKRAQERVKKYPNDDSFKSELKEATDRIQETKQKLLDYRMDLLDIAIQIAKLKQSQINEQLKKAIHYFETGQLETAKAFLKEITSDFEDHVAECERQKESLTISQEIVNLDIQADLLQVKVLMADPTNIAVEERITEANNIYLRIINGAQRSGLDDKIQAEVLLEYARFLNRHDMADKAIEMMERLLVLCEQAYSSKSLMMANALDEMGRAYEIKKENTEAQEFYTRAWDIRKKLCDKWHRDIATSINNLGRIYSNLGDDEFGDDKKSSSYYEQALKFYTKALNIRRQTLGDTAPETARSYNNVGEACSMLNKYVKAINNYMKALTIFQKPTNRKECKEEIASVRGNLGRALYATGHTDEALKHLKKAQKFFTAEFGLKHNKTASVLYYLGDVYMKEEDYTLAAGCYDKAYEYFSQTRTFGTFMAVLGLKRSSAHSRMQAGKAPVKKKK